MNKKNIINQIKTLKKHIEQYYDAGLIFSAKCAESELKELYQKLEDAGYKTNH